MPLADFEEDLLAAALVVPALEAFAEDPLAVDFAELDLLPLDLPDGAAPFVDPDFEAEALLAPEVLLLLALDDVLALAVFEVDDPVDLPADALAVLLFELVPEAAFPEALFAEDPEDFVAADFPVPALAAVVFDELDFDAVDFDPEDFALEALLVAAPEDFEALGEEALPAVADDARAFDALSKAAF